MRTLAVYNLKGGVGKTTTAVNMAYLSSQQGFKTLIWDLDPQGASSWYFDSSHTRKISAKKILQPQEIAYKYVQKTGYENLDIIPSDVSFRDLDHHLKEQGELTYFSEVLNQFRDNYSLIILDCPPGISHLTDNVIYASDGILMPVIPTWLSLHSYTQLKTYLKDNQLPRRHIYPFFNMVDVRKKLHMSWLRVPPSNIKKMLKTSINTSSNIEKMGAHRAPLETYDEQSDIAAAYRALWKEISKKISVF
ncbi:MAG: ParA family protein [Gammaproteobacteria bacterium]|nr:ParA family protein [Gammaproteobacteria bacterium]